MVFAAQQLHDKCQEQNRGLYTTCDIVSLEGLWKIMSKFGCLEKFISIARQFHVGMFAWVLESGQSSCAFPVTNGVKQGYVLAPMLF